MNIRSNLIILSFCDLIKLIITEFNYVLFSIDLKKKYAQNCWNEINKGETFFFLYCCLFINTFILILLFVVWSTFFLDIIHTNTIQLKEKYVSFRSIHIEILVVAIFFLKIINWEQKMKKILWELHKRTYLLIILYLYVISTFIAIIIVIISCYCLQVYNFYAKWIVVRVFNNKIDQFYIFPYL